MRIRIQIQEHESRPKLTKKTGFLPFKKAFVPSYRRYVFLAIVTYFKRIFFIC